MHGRALSDMSFHRWTAEIVARSFFGAGVSGTRRLRPRRLHLPLPPCGDKPALDAMASQGSVFEGRCGRMVEDPPRESTSAPASAPPQEGIEQGDCAVVTLEEHSSEDLDDECEECGSIPAERCARCGGVVCVRCGWRGKHVTEAVRDILSEGPLPVLSEVERNRTVELCLAAAAQQTLEDDRAGGKVLTGDAITREAMSRHVYYTQMHGTTGHALSAGRATSTTCSTTAEGAGLPRRSDG